MEHANPGGPILPSAQRKAIKAGLWRQCRAMILLTAGSLALGACASNPAILEHSNIPLVQNQSLPVPGGADLMGASRPYQIAPLDTLSVSVFGIDDLSREGMRVDAGGMLTYPLIGSVSAAGLTTEELAAAIAAKLRDNLVRNPQVSVNVTETVSQVVTVDGEVSKPGLYPVFGRMTLQRAVATAGGVGEYANLEDVVIFRTVDGQRMAGLYNLGAIRAGAYDDPEVFSNDIVIVGDSESRRMFRDVLRASPLLTTPLLILFR